MTNTNPMICYYVAYRGTVRSARLVKETGLGYFLAFPETYQPKESFIRKDRITLFPTFEAAQAKLVSEIKEKQQALAKDLAEALALTPPQET